MNTDHSVEISNYRKFPEHLRSSLEPSKTQSFHLYLVNFVIEILASRISYLIPHHFPPCFIANEFRQLCSLKNIMRIKNLCVSKIIQIPNREQKT